MKVLAIQIPDGRIVHPNCRGKAIGELKRKHNPLWFAVNERVKAIWVTDSRSRVYRKHCEYCACPMSEH